LNDFVNFGLPGRQKRAFRRFLWRSSA